MTGIYCYYNTVNGKRYIGQAQDLDRRKKDHYVRAFNDFPSNSEYNSVIHQAFRKYGYDKFEYFVLEECSVSELNDREVYWIKYYDSYCNGYNCNSGGSEKHFIKLDPNILENIKNDLIFTELTFEEIRKKYNVSVGFVSDFNQGNIWKQDNITYPFRNPKKKVYTCSVCGKELYSKSITGMCHNCYSISTRKTTRPTREELKYLIRNYSFVEIGKNYGVTDNAIKKWCDGYLLPRKKSEIKSYSDVEWENI